MKKCREIIESIGIIPVINITDLGLAQRLAETLISEGLSTIEVTLRSECSLDAISEIKNHFPEMLVGAGTVLDCEAVDKAVSAGADYIVCPGFDEEVIDYCLEKNIEIFPGCTSASEIQKAYKKGLRVLKFFPAELSGGVDAINLLSGPFKGVKFIPTGGISFSNLKKYLSCPAVLACGGSFMATSEQLKKRDFDAIRTSCRKAASIAAKQEVDNSKAVTQDTKHGCRMKKVVGFGDYILRLNPLGFLKFIQSPNWEANFTGAEANVCVSLSNMGVKTDFVTKLPENEIARCAISSLDKYRVGTENIARGGDRIGLFYVEKGASQRPSRVIYDRMNSSFIQSTSKDYDWDKIFADAGYFHFTGITPALDPNVASLCEEALKKAKEHGLSVSCDLNYRKNLWTTEQAKATMEKLLAYVDVLIANEEDAEKVLGISAPDSDVIHGKLSRDGYIYVAEQISKKYGIKKVAITLRKSISASDNNWSGLLYTDGQAYFSKEYNIHLVDRVGGGDSFGAGLIYATGHGFSNKDCIEFAVAASCLKQTMEWDVNLATVDEILSLMGGDSSGRVQR